VSRRRRLGLVGLVAAMWGAGLVSAPASAKEPPPPLPREYAHPSGAFAFRVPESWSVDDRRRQGVVEAGAGDLRVRFVYDPRELGYDALHVTCMLERLAGPMETEPRVRYERDFLSWSFEDKRALESAFVVRYDRPVLGHKEWRQRNITVVGPGLSLCAISYAPLKQWKKSAATRATLDAVLASLTFRR
jgi:hypothetical protein